MVLFYANVSADHGLSTVSTVSASFDMRNDEPHAELHVKTWTATSEHARGTDLDQCLHCTH
jgi:hypothetical protein